GGVVPTAEQLATALNAGLNIGIVDGVDTTRAGVDNGDHYGSGGAGNAFTNLAGAVNHVFRANKVLAPLYDDPRFAEIKDTLRALNNNVSSSTIIDVARDITLSLLDALPISGGVVPTAEQLATALNAGLNIGIVDGVDTT